MAVSEKVTCEGQTGGPTGVQVTVQLDWDALEPGVQVVLQPSGEGATGMETEEFRSWVAGAVHGVRYALAHAKATPCVVRVVQLGIPTTGACAAPVAAAAAFAVWEALGIEPTTKAITSIHQQVAMSSAHRPDWLPDFVH